MGQNGKLDARVGLNCGTSAKGIGLPCVQSAKIRSNATHQRAARKD